MKCSIGSLGIFDLVEAGEFVFVVAPMSIGIVPLCGKWTFAPTLGRLISLVVFNLSYDEILRIPNAGSAWLFHAAQ
jgi:hypothetical protein